MLDITDLTVCPAVVVFTPQPVTGGQGSVNVRVDTQGTSVRKVNMLSLVLMCDDDDDDDDDDVK